MASDDRERTVEDLVAGYVDRLNRGERVTPDQVHADHPDLAGEILEHLELFVDLSGPGGDEHFGTPGALGTLGDYTLRRQIGRGGMGVVYEAWQGSMDRAVALKVMPRAVAADTRAVARFVQEAQIAGKLHHANIVRVFGMGVEEQVPYYAMELVEGHTLAEIVARRKAAEPGVETAFGKPERAGYYERIAEVFADVADGLQHAHARKVIHRDIKPSNLILDGEGRLRILDFGLAHLEGQEGLTVSGDVLGTPQYMSPEQARRKKIPVDHRTDVYSLGATLYELLTLEPPFRGKDHQETLSQIIQHDAVPPSRIDERVPRDLETIVLKCLRKEAVDRYGTAEALGQDLRRFVRRDAIEARPEGRWERAARFVRARRIALSLGGLGLAVAVLLAVVAGSWFAEGSRRSALRYEALVAEGRLTLDLAYAARVQQTIQDRQASVWLDRSSPFTRDLSGRRLRQLLERAESELRKAAALLPGRGEARAQLERIARLRDAGSLQAGELESDPVARGVAHLLSGRHDPARLELAIARGRLPDSPAPVLLVAQSYVLAGDEESADAWLERCFLETAPAAREELAMSIAEFWFAQPGGRRTPSAISSKVERIERWLEHVPDSLARRQALLMAYAVADPRRALEAGHRALELAPDDPITHSQLAAIHSWDLADPTRAEQHANWAYGLGSSDPGVLTLVGQVWYELGRHRDAIAVAEAALGLESGNVRPQFVIGMSRVMLGECAEAEKAYREVLERHPGDADALGYLSGALGCQGKHEEGLNAALEAVKSAPASSGAYTHLGNRYSQLGRFDEAAQAYQRALELSPDNRHTMWNWANVCYQQGDFDRCLVLLCEAIPRAASAVHTSAGARSTFARLLQGIPRPKDLSPLDGFIERCEAKPDGGDPPAIVLEGLALAYLHAPRWRNIERAMAFARRAVETTRWQSVGPLVTLASVQLAAGAAGEATRLLEEHLDLARHGEHREFLAACRREFQPDLASFASVDELFAEEPVDVDLLAAAFVALEALEPTPERQATIAYFRARLAEREGRCEDAAAAFAAAFQGGGESAPRKIPKVGPCIEGSPELRGAVVEACHAVLAGPAGEGARGRALAALESLDSRGDEIPALGAVHVWWILGPLDDSSGLWEDGVDPLSVDLEAGLERGGKVWSWRRHLFPGEDVDLSAIFGPLRGASALLDSEIHVPREVELQATLEVDDQVAVFLNDVEVYRFEGARMVARREHVFQATCHAGANRLLLRVRNLGGNWGVTLRLDERDGTPLRFRQRL